MLRLLRGMRLLRQDASSNSSSERSEDAIAEAKRHIAEGAWEHAISSYRRAIALDDSNDKAYVGLGYALKETGAWPLAIDAFAAALQRNPAEADAHYLLGNMALVERRHESAAAHLLAAIQHNPLLAPAYPEAALCLFRLGKQNEAFTLLTRGIRLMPQQAELHFAQGNLLAESLMYREAVQAYERAVRLAPDFAEALANLGNCERHLGMTRQALQHIDAALVHQPQNAAWHSNRLFTLQYSGHLDRAELFREHLRFSEIFETPLDGQRLSKRLERAHAPRRLRIGYVSGDFRQHSLAYFFEPVLRHHDTQKVEISCYYTYPRLDSVSHRLKALADHWHDCADMSDADMVKRIQDDEIDVLIDLSGHTGYNRLTVFAHKPAPVQITWLGYQATTGLSSMDYRITDEGIDPVGQTEAYHSEELLRLSSGAVFQPDPASPPVGPLPCIDSGIFTFGCLNNPAKITPQFIAAAAAILRGSPGSRLLLGNMNAGNTPRMLQDFAAEGVAPDRLALVGNKQLHEYLGLHSEIDLALDTFPYNGGTTTMHSLWMGVPVLALDGDSAISRVGVQMMRGLGFDSFAATDIEDYIARAIAMTGNRPLLQATRALLRSRMDSRMVEQAKTYTRELEDTFISLNARRRPDTGPSQSDTV